MNRFLTARRHFSTPWSEQTRSRGNEWSLRAFASMPSTAIFLRARAEIKNLLCELVGNAKIWEARASKHSFKFCEQLKNLMDHSSPLVVWKTDSCFFFFRGV